MINKLVQWFITNGGLHTCKLHLQLTEMQSRLKGMMTGGRNYKKILKTKMPNYRITESKLTVACIPVRSICSWLRCSLA
jgi:hypothetical protein